MNVVVLFFEEGVNDMITELKDLKVIKVKIVVPTIDLENVFFNFLSPKHVKMKCEFGVFLEFIYSHEFINLIY